MSEQRNPWVKWYPADWRADPKLRMCSVAARGVWVDMLGFMHEAEPYGHLIVAGVAPNEQQLAVLIGTTVAVIRKAIAELEAAGVFSRTDSGAIFSRRMVRDRDKADLDRARGKQGGNPKLLFDDNGGVNPPVNHWVNGGDKAQKPEARSQKPDKILSLTARQIDLDFEAWWPLFPRKVGKGQARKAYHASRKNPCVTAEILLAAAKRFAASRAGEDEKFTPHPATWLNGERWLDGAASGTAAVIEPDRELSQWRAEVRSWCLTGTWQPRGGGGQPGSPDCRVPKAVLAEFSTEIASRLGNGARPTGSAPNRTSGSGISEAATAPTADPWAPHEIPPVLRRGAA